MHLMVCVLSWALLMSPLQCQQSSGKNPVKRANPNKEGEGNQSPKEEFTLSLDLGTSMVNDLKERPFKGLGWPSYYVFGDSSLGRTTTQSQNINWDRHGVRAAPHLWTLLAAWGSRSLLASADSSTAFCCSLFLACTTAFGFMVCGDSMS